MENRLGGAANVALNLINLGCNVSLMGFAGEDNNSRILIKEIERNCIKNFIFIEKEYKTIIKTRIVSKNQQLLRLDEEIKVSKKFLNKLFDRLKEIINKYDLILFSDYDKGCLEDITKLIELCKTNKIPVIVDPKQINFEKYHGVDLITPNINEFESMVGECKNKLEIEKKANFLINKLSLEGILVTQGAEGVSFIDKYSKVIHQKADEIDVYDVTGAGDTFIAILPLVLLWLDYHDSLFF